MKYKYNCVLTIVSRVARRQPCLQIEIEMQDI